MNEHNTTVKVFSIIFASHWRIQEGATLPPFPSNFLKFHEFLEKMVKIIVWPSPLGLVPLLSGKSWICHCCLFRNCLRSWTIDKLGSESFTRLLGCEGHMGWARRCLCPPSVSAKIPHHLWVPYHSTCSHRMKKITLFGSLPPPEILGYKAESNH